MLTRDEPSLGSRVPWLAGVVAAGWALIAGAGLAVLPALVLWISDGAADPVTAPARTGGLVWLAAHRVPLAMADGGTLQLVPGGLSLLIVLLLYRAGRWTAHVTAVGERATVAHIMVPAAAGYGAAGAVAARFAANDQLSSSPAWAAVWCGAVALTAMGSGVVREAPDAAGLTALPSSAKVAARGAAGIVLALLAAGAVLTAASVVLHAEEIGSGVEALRVDVPGLVVLAALNMALVVNAMVWGAAYALGPGFVLGTDRLVSPLGIDDGPLPVIPLLGAVPAGTGGTIGWLVIAGPVGAGLVGGALVWRHASGEPRLHLMAMGMAAGALAAAGMSVLALLSGGSAGVQRLAEVGPVPWQVAAATLVLTGLSAAAVAGLMDGLPQRAWIGGDGWGRPETDADVPADAAGGAPDDDEPADAPT